MSTAGKIITGCAICLLVIVALGAGAFLFAQRTREANRAVVRAHQVIEHLQQILSTLKDAETGQRGFILTGQRRYLEPYQAATGQIQDEIETLLTLTRDNADQQQDIQRVQKLSRDKLAELQETIKLREESGQQAALQVILTDRGMKIMDQLRGVVAEMTRREQQLLDVRNEAADAQSQRTIWMIAVWMPGALLVLAVAAILLMSRVRRAEAAAPLASPGRAWAGLAVRYVLAVIVVAVAAVLRWWLMQYFGPLPTFVTFFPAVLLVASLGGGGPGIVATILAALVSDYWFIEPIGSFTVGAPNDMLGLGIFTGSGLILSLLAERLRRARWAEATCAAQQAQLEELARLNDELSHQAEHLAQQNEELAQQSEELTQQSEEMTQQNEELQTQSEEIQTLNAELGGREGMLQKLLDSARLGSAEQGVLRDICAAALEMFGPATSAVAVYERQGEQLVIRAQAGLWSQDAAIAAWPVANSFGYLVMEENKTACLNDAALRPDLALLQVPGQPPFRAALAAPMRADGRPFGLVAVYSLQQQQWTAVQFRLTEWLAARCAQILETLRLQAQSQLQATALQSAANAIVITGRDGAIQWVNEAFTRLTGYAAAEAIGQNPRVLNSGKQDAAFFQQLWETILAGHVWRGELVNKRKDGALYTEEMTITPVTEADGTIAHFIAIKEDISARKRVEAALRESEQRFRLLFEQAAVGIKRLDPQGRMLEVNDTLCGILGYSHDELLKLSIEDITHSEDLPQERAELARLLSHQIANFSIEKRCLRKDGSIIWVRVTSSLPSEDGVGAPWWLSVVEDITQRKQTEQALRITAEELGRSNKDLEQFAYVASHDLQEPLRMVTGFVQLLQQNYGGRLDADADKYIGYAVDGAKRMRSLIDDLLTYSRAGSRGQTLAPTDVGAALRQALANLRTGIEETAAEITCGELPTIPADHVQLVQLFQNLVGNALRFRGDAPPQIHVDAVRKDDHWLFAVRDNGIGIDPEYRDRIFLIFQRLHTRKQYPGTGIGLAICKKIVDRHGGRIWVESQEGQGATFHFTLPAQGPVKE